MKLDIFDEEILDKGDKILKIAIYIVCFVLCVGAFVQNGKEQLGAVSKAKNEIGGIMEQVQIATDTQPSSVSTLSSEDATYFALMCIVQEKGYGACSFQKIKEILTEEEKLALETVIRSASYSGSSTSEIYEKLETDKEYRIKCLGLQNCEVLYNIVNNHKEEFK